MGSWDFETGLPDDFDLEITNAHFAYNPKLGQGGEPKIGLHLEGKAEGGTFEEPTVLTEESALLFSVGDKWMITDDGARLVDEGGRDRGFHVKSAITRILRSAVEAGAPLKDRGNATDARIWVGLKVHFKRRLEKMGGEIGDREVLYIEKYLGEGEKATSGARAATKTEKAAAAAPAGDDVTMMKDLVGGAILKRLEKVATEAEDYDTFASEASELPKVKDSDEAQEVILDEERGTALWKALRGE